MKEYMKGIVEETGEKTGDGKERYEVVKMADQGKIRQAVRLLLEGIGEDPQREGLLETPDRIARMYEELCAGINEDASEHLQKTFHVENNEMVVEKDITFYSL